MFFFSTKNVNFLLDIKFFRQMILNYRFFVRKEIFISLNKNFNNAIMNKNQSFIIVSNNI